MAAPTPLVKPPLTYVAIGASDAVGVGVEDPDRDGWVPNLARSLPQPTRLVNLGIPGVVLSQAMEVEVPPALDAQPNLVTVWLVVNDVLGKVSLEDYRSGLADLLTRLKNGTHAAIDVANIPNPPASLDYRGLPKSERPAITAAWNAVIAAETQVHGAVLVDLYSNWPLRDHPEFIGPDGLHPTAAGYHSLAKVYLDVLRAQRVV